MTATRTSAGIASRFHSRQAFSQLDMTPMADIAFLLVAFFMLSSGFLQKAPAEIKLPQSSGYFCEPPSTDVLTLTVARDGQLFFDIDGSVRRAALLRQMGEKYGVSFSEKQLTTFSTIHSFGMDIQQLPGYLALPTEAQDQVKHPGIPTPQFADWIDYAHTIYPRLVVFIKADEAVHYSSVKAVIDVLQAHKISRMRLVTNREPYES